MRLPRANIARRQQEPSVLISWISRRVR